MASHHRRRRELARDRVRILAKLLSTLTPLEGELVVGGETPETGELDGHKPTLTSSLLENPEFVLKHHFRSS